MAVDSLAIWKDTLEKLQPTGNISWAINFANWVDQRVTSKLVVGGGVSESKFTFNKAVFAAALQLITPSSDALSGIKNFADAWEKALIASIIVVPPGAFLSQKSDSTTWSVVASSIIDPPSILIGKAIILTLVTAPLVGSARESLFSEKFRNAFLALTVTVTGTNSDSKSPAPLVSPLTPVK